MYGQTEEAGGIIAGQRGRFPRPGNVGTPVEGIEVRLADDGEILVRGPDLFEAIGALTKPRARSSVPTVGCAPATSVNGAMEACGSSIARAGFHCHAGGKTISPSLIENALRASPYIAEAIVFGHGKKYLTAVLEIDFDTVATGRVQTM
jgi:long-chain acyl-CoA synthetase